MFTCCNNCNDINNNCNDIYFFNNISIQLDSYLELTPCSVEPMLVEKKDKCSLMLEGYHIGRGLKWLVYFVHFMEIIDWLNDFSQRLMRFWLQINKYNQAIIYEMLNKGNYWIIDYHVVEIMISIWWSASLLINFIVFILFKNKILILKHTLNFLI